VSLARMGGDVSETTDVTFDIDLEDGRIAHCWQAEHVEYRNSRWSAGLVKGIEPDIFYLRIEQTDREEEPLTILLRSDELMAMIYVASSALWSAELMGMEERDDD